MVREFGHHGLVERYLAQRGIRQLHGVPLRRPALPQLEHRLCLSSPEEPSDDEILRGERGVQHGARRPSLLAPHLGVFGVDGQQHHVSLRRHLLPRLCIPL